MQRAEEEAVDEPQWSDDSLLDGMDGHIWGMRTRIYDIWVLYSGYALTKNRKTPKDHWEDQEVHLCTRTHREVSLFQYTPLSLHDRRRTQETRASFPEIQHPCYWSVSDLHRSSGHRTVW